MIKIIILTIILPAAISLCYNQCQQCKDSNSNPSPYACLTCISNQITPYIYSCTLPSDSTSAYLAPAVIITLLHLFMLAIGMAAYRELYEQIQLASLLTWRYNFSKGSNALQVTNFAVVNTNDFVRSYGYQFMILVLVLFCFIAVMAMTDKMVHSPLATLIRRKKIIFPVRLITLTFNALLLCSLIQLATANDIVSFSIFPFALAAVALTTLFVFLVWVGVISNWKKFQVDDPHYYVLLEQMTSKRWYAKNSVLICLLTRAAMICTYVGSFSSPATAGIIIVILQTAYSVYYLLLLRFTKIRYLLVMTISNFLMISILVAAYVGAISDIGSSGWENSGLAHLVLLMLMVILFFGSCCMELVFRRERVIKQLKSIYYRFIKCEKLQEKVETSKYDQHSHREKVVEFRTNLLYQRDFNQDRGITIEMQAQTSS